MNPAARPSTRRLLLPLAILALCCLFPAWPGAARRPAQQVTIEARLISVADDRAELGFDWSALLVSDFVGGDPVVEKLNTGLYLGFTPTIPADPNDPIGVDLDFALTLLDGQVQKETIQTPDGKRKVQRAYVQTFSVNRSFEAYDGETVILDTVPPTAQILATPRLVGGVDPTMVQIEVRVPFGGEQIRVGDLRLVDEASLTSVADRQSSLSKVTRRSFASGVIGGQVVPSLREFGVDFDVLPQILSDVVDLDVGVRSRIPGATVPVFAVPTQNGNVKLQLPELGTLDLRTRVLVDDGQTLVLGGLRAGDTEALVFVDANLVTGGGLDNVAVSSRVVVFGGDPREPKRDGEASNSVKDLDLVSREEQPMYLSRTTQHDVVTGYDADGPVVSPLEVGTRLEVKPTLLGGGHVLLELVIDDSSLDPARIGFPLKTPQGKGALDLPIVHTTRVDTAVSVEDGQTVVVGGLRHDELRSRSRTRTELLVLVTPELVAGGDPDDVGVGARVVSSSEGEGPASDSVERAESGPVAD